MATINATGTYPSADGVRISNDTIVAVELVGDAADLVGTVQYRDSEGTWTDIPDPDSDQDIAAGILASSTGSGYMKPVLGGDGMRIRLNITGITPGTPGTGYYSYGFYTKRFR